MPSGIATEFKTKNQTARGVSNSGAAKGAPSEKKPRAARGRGAQSNHGRGKPPGSGTPSAGPPLASNNEGAEQNPSSNPQGGQNPLPKQGAGYDPLPCLFCGQQQHPARSCPQYMKPGTVYLKAVEALLSLNCLKMGHYASSCPHPGCSMEGCNARHHKLLHGHSNPTRKNL